MGTTPGTRSGYKTTLIDISASTTISEPVECDGMDLVAIQTPSAMTGTALTFQGSADGVTYAAIYDDAGTAISVTSAASRYIMVGNTLLKALRGLRFLKVVSGSAEAADRTIGLVFADR